MELRNYQQKVIERFETYLRTLREKQDEAEDYAEFQRSKGRVVKLANYPKETWDDLNQQRLLPALRRADGTLHPAEHLDRFDGMDRPVPSVCFKVPTAGGKTLLATVAVERVQMDYLQRQTGFVLWVVPSDAIYRQTWGNLADREHPYRQMLERASGGRVKLLERFDAFAPADVREYLCVMVLMLPAANRQSNETLRMFRDSGRFTGFFPEVDDYAANEALLQKVRNLDVNELDGPSGIATGLSIRHSLGNTLRLLRPAVVVDEGHKAYSELARRTLAGFNPSFILELSATPNVKERRSNVLVDVPGTALKDEQMVKLPIVLSNEPTDWKGTLAAAHARLEALSQTAEQLQATKGRYIRPIGLIRVDRTGKEQRDGLHVHAEDAREYLAKALGVPATQIRVKSASVDELGDEDLLSTLSEVRWVITKDALREGWDCPFAYVLVVLSRTTAYTAMTQMIGRVLRQPQARSTPEEVLNQSYVFCFDQEVGQAVESVRKGLEEEGMGDLAGEIRSEGDRSRIRTEVIRRRDPYHGVRILLPQVLHVDDADGWRPLDYDRDILGDIDWDAIRFAMTFNPDDHDRLERTITRIDVRRTGEQFALDFKTRVEEHDGGADLDLPYLVRQLMDAVPNPWQAARMVEETLAALRKRVTEAKLYTNRVFLIQEMRRDLQAQVNAAAEALFRRKLADGEITFRLVTSPEALNWELAETLEVSVTDADRRLNRGNGEPLERLLFEKVFEKDVNGLERPVALYLDAELSVRWWHRLVAKADWHLQGWQRNRVFPDFLVALNEGEDHVRRFSVLETKGAQLKGNDDTAYKQRLFDVLERAYNEAVEAGHVEVVAENDQRFIFTMLLEESWRAKMPQALGRA